MVTARIRTVIVNSQDPERLAAFWSSLLGVEVAERDDAAGIVWLQPDTPGGVNLGFQRVERKRSDSTETHVDVAVADLDAAEVAVGRLGGRVVARNGLATGFEWRVLADPDGNEFCLFVE